MYNLNYKTGIQQLQRTGMQPKGLDPTSVKMLQTWYAMAQNVTQGKPNEEWLPLYGFVVEKKGMSISGALMTIWKNDP